MKTVELRSILESLLGYTGTDSTAWPGYYTQANGTKIKAVWVEGMQITPKEWTITGLELTIVEFPNVAPEGMLAGSLLYERIWEARIRQFGTTSLNAYVERVQRHFAGFCRTRIFKGTDTTPPSATFYIRDPDWTTGYLYGGSTNHTNFL